MSEIRIENCDCLEFLGKLADNSVDLTVTSPPYDKQRNYGNDWIFDFESTAKELYRISKDGGVVVWVVNDQTKNGCESLTSFKQAIFFVEQCGFKLHDTMIYSAYRVPLTHKRYEQQFEYMFVFVKGKLKTFNGIKEKSIYGGVMRSIYGNSASNNEKNSKMGGKYGKPKCVIKETKLKGNIWHYNVGYGHTTKDKIAYQHPAIFPEKLAEDHILSWSNENDLVFDPFLGSGTVAKMCKKLNRNFIGCEINKKYCDIAKARLDARLIANDINVATKSQPLDSTNKNTTENSLF